MRRGHIYSSKRISGAREQLIFQFKTQCWTKINDTPVNGLYTNNWAPVVKLLSHTFKMEIIEKLFFNFFFFSVKLYILLYNLWSRLTSDTLLVLLPNHVQPMKLQSVFLPLLFKNKIKTVVTVLYFYVKI